MPTTDEVLLNQLIASHSQLSATQIEESEQFELFAVELILKDFDLSYDELEAGIVDGGNDGGIDGFYTFADGNLLAEDADTDLYRRGVDINIIVVQSKITGGFSERSIDSLTPTMRNILDFTKSDDALQRLYSEKLFQRFSIFRRVYLELTPKFPNLRVDYYYATKGQQPNSIVADKAIALEKDTVGALTSCTSGFHFLGARSLLELARKLPSSTLNVRLSEGSIYRADEGIVALIKLEDYYEFITTESGVLRKSLFESNVRDYQGKTEVNDGIQSSLKEVSNEENFWWLNNGISVICADMNLSFPILTVQDPQVVNGLQTSTEIFEYFHNGQRSDSREVLVRFVKPSSTESANRIIRATNSQTKIPDASLRATDSVQRDIEDYFGNNDLYYDRRKNYYKNQGKPMDNIIGIPYLAQAYMAIVLRRPNDSRARPTSLLKREDTYTSIFSDTNPVHAYLVCAKTMKRIESFLRLTHPGLSSAERNNLKFHMAMVVTTLATRSSSLSPSRISQLDVKSLTDSLLSQSFDLTSRMLKQVQVDHGTSADVAAKSVEYVSDLETRLDEIVQKMHQSH